MPDPSARTPPIKGALSPLRAFQLRGWAHAPANPDEHLQIEVRLDGALICTTTASLYLEHLEIAKIGGGDHAFVANLERELPLAEPERIKVTATTRFGQSLRLTPANPGAKPVPVLAAAVEAQKSGYRYQAEDRAQHPVLVLGSARSGTTAMAQALHAHTRYAGHGEGHLLDLLPKLLETVHGHYDRRKREKAPGVNTMIAHVPQAVIEDGVRALFVELVRGLFPTGAWLDKSPGVDMIRAAPALRLIWPDLKVIFMRRRPIENIESRRRKFPTIGFEEHCTLWADCMTAWETVRGKLAGVAIEIDQTRLARRPGEIVAELTTLLTLDPREAARLLQSLEHDWPERSSADLASVQSLDSVDWNEDQRRRFRAICGPVMARFGYAEDGLDAA